MIRVLLCLILIVAWGWTDLVDWLGFWWAFTLCYLMLSFPFACLVGQFLGGNEQERQK